MSEFLLPVLFLVGSIVLTLELRRSWQSGQTLFEGIIGDREGSPLKFKIGLGLNVAWLLICLIALVGSFRAALA